MRELMNELLPPRCEHESNQQAGPGPRALRTLELAPSDGLRVAGARHLASGVGRCSSSAPGRRLRGFFCSTTSSAVCLSEPLPTLRDRLIGRRPALRRDIDASTARSRRAFRVHDECAITPCFGRALEPFAVDSRRRSG